MSPYRCVLCCTVAGQFVYLSNMLLQLCIPVHASDTGRLAVSELLHFTNVVTLNCLIQRLQSNIKHKYKHTNKQTKKETSKQMNNKHWSIEGP